MTPVLRGALIAAFVSGAMLGTAPSSANAQSGQPELLLIKPKTGGLSNLDGDSLYGKEPEAKPVDPVAEAAAKCLNDPADRLSCAMATGSAGGLETFSGRLETVIIRKKPKADGNAGVDVTALDAPAAGGTDATGSDPDSGGGLVMNEVDILFDYDSADLRDSEQGKIVQLANGLKHAINAEARFVFIGHTDGKGTEDYNCRLSQRRADAVVAALVTQGVSTGQLVALGAGEHILRRPDDPLAEANRRVGVGKWDAAANAVVADVVKLCRK